MKALIFDLDQTLVDTSVLEPFRNRREWGTVYANIHMCTMYPGMREVLDYIKEKGYKVAIVSSSPRPYVERMVSAFSLPAGYIIGYHDAKPIKPHPAPMLKALELMGELPSNVVSFGDRVVDMAASNAAGIESVACLWGTKERSALESMRVSYKLESPSQVFDVI